MKWRSFLGIEKRSQVYTQKDLTTVELFGGSDLYGQRVNATRIECLSAGLAAIDAISSTVASLPCFVYQISSDGRHEDGKHDLALLVRNGPNPNQTWPDFVQWLLASALRYGNALAELLVEDGRLVGLRPIRWELVECKILHSGRLVYEFYDPLLNTRRRLLDTDALHLRDRSDDGLIGIARHTRAAPVFASALALGEFTGKGYERGTFLSGVLKHPTKISAPALTRLKSQWAETYGGSRNSGKTAILEEGMEWQQLNSNPEDMELLAARRFAVEEAARIYAVPGPLINDHSHSTFSNSETLIRFFAQGTLTNWCRKLEAEFHRSLFSDTDRATRAFVIDLSGLLRGDPAQRWAANKIAVDAKILTPNEIRDQEGFNPRPGGDTFPDAKPPATV